MTAPIDLASIEEWATMRDRLIARRTVLRAELEAIDAALAPLHAPNSPRAVRRARRSADSVQARAEDYLREHPDVTSREIATAVGVEINRIGSILNGLLRRGLVTRRHDTGKPWRWTLALDAPPAAPPLEAS